MAAIDKMYLNQYDFERLRIWALRYYRKLFLYMYCPFVSSTEFKNWQKEKHESYKSYAIRDYENYGGPEGGFNAIYGKLVEDGYEPEHAKETANDIISTYNNVMLPTYDEEWYEEEIAVTNTPLKVDRWLLWHCPLDFVREYLEKNCGYKTRWYHKIFWKGKSY